MACTHVLALALPIRPVTHTHWPTAPLDGDPNQSYVDFEFCAAEETYGHPTTTYLNLDTERAKRETLTHSHHRDHNTQK